MLMRIFLVALAVLTTGANAAGTVSLNATVSMSASMATVGSGVVSGSVAATGGIASGSAKGTDGGASSSPAVSASEATTPKVDEVVFTFPAKDGEPSGTFTFVEKDGKIGVMTKDMVKMEGLAWHLHTKKLTGDVAAYGATDCGPDATAGHFGVSDTMFAAIVKPDDDAPADTPVGTITFTAPKTGATAMMIGFDFPVIKGVTGMHLHKYNSTKGNIFKVGANNYNATVHKALVDGELDSGVITGGDLSTRFTITDGPFELGPIEGTGEAVIAVAEINNGNSAVVMHNNDDYWVAVAVKALESGDLSTKFGALTNTDGDFDDVMPFLKLADIKATSLVLHAADGSRLQCVNGADGTSGTPGNDGAASNLTPAGMVVALFAALAVAMRA